MNLVKCVHVILFCIGLSSCSFGTSPSGVNDGTGDSGGGNSYKGRPLESYIRKPKDLAAFQKFLEPVRDHSSFSNLGKLIEGMFEYKTWYFVPGPLDGLPSGKIGSAVPTDQVALQDFDAVWIDSEIFDTMSVEDQARLLIHEFLMGAKLLKLDSYFHTCELLTAPNYERETCNGASKIKRGRPSDLTSQDYAQIRAVTEHVFRLDLEMSVEDWEDLLGKSDFDDPPFFQFRIKDSEKKYSIGEIAEKIQSAAALGYVPRYGYDLTHPEAVISGQSCAVDFSFRDDVITFRMQSEARSVEHEAKYFDEVKLSRTEEYGKVLWSGHLFQNFLPGDHHLGDRIYTFEIGFENETKLHHVEVIEMMCANSDCSSMRNPSEGFHYFCAMDGNLKF